MTLCSILPLDRELKQLALRGITSVNLLQLERQDTMIHGRYL